MICPYCRKEIPDNSKFCRGCGKKIEQTRTEKGLRSLLRRISRLIVIEIVIVATLLVGSAIVYTRVILPNQRRKQEQRIDLTEAELAKREACRRYKQGVLDAYVNLEYLKATVESYALRYNPRDQTTKPYVVVRLENLGPYPVTRIHGVINCEEFINELGETNQNVMELFTEATDYEMQPLFPRGEREKSFFVLNCISDLEGQFLRTISVDVDEVELNWDVKPMFGFEPPPPDCINY